MSPGPEGTFTMIVNSKKLNKCVEAPYFKTESIKNVLCMTEPGAWMASVDLKDAFFTIPIHSDYQKFFKFIHKRIPYEFSSMPNGYSDAMRVFTKVLKPAFSYLREIGYLSVVYVDDSYLQGETFEECLQNITETVRLLQSLGFTIHPEKSVLKPTQKLTFLGFVLNSKTMTLTLTDAKKEKIIKLGEGIINRQYITIRELAQFIGNVVATFEAVLTGPLHYRDMETLKIAKLKQYKGKFDAKITINEESKTEIKWWIENIKGCSRNLITREVDITIYTDASNTGWGGTNGVSSINGRWSIEEQKCHINELELLAIKFCLQSFCKDLCNKVICIMSDNATAISYVDHMGETKSARCNDIAREIWNWLLGKGIWICANHIPGQENTEADQMSCTFTDHTEWMLFDEIFKKICVPPDIDLFANGLNEYDRLNMFLVNKIQNLALFTHFQKIGNNLLI